MSSERITRTRAIELLDEHKANGKGKVFSVLFKTRGDGSDRRMQARFSVKKGVKGTGTPGEQLRAQGLIKVYEFGVKGGHKNIPVEGLKELTINGQHYIITTPVPA